MPLAERLRVGEFLRTYGELYGLRDTAGPIARELKRFRIPHLAEKMCTELSSGQRTLVGIVKATVHRCDSLLVCVFFKRASGCGQPQRPCVPHALSGVLGSDLAWR